jgi:hypothetical protein
MNINSLIPKYAHVTVVSTTAITGGTELLHQLVNEIRNNGGTASICYWPFGPNHAVPLQFRRYNCPTIEMPIDHNDCAVVVPEVLPLVLLNLKLSARYLWWLSVDNFFGPEGILAKRAVLNLLRLKMSRRIVHLYQSEYARVFLRRMGFRWIEVLHDYVNDDFDITGRGPTSKENIVTYNPKKGARYTERLLRSGNDIQFFALENMTTREIIDVLSRAKVYIDFGHHPGKDRIPREAAMCDTIVIVGTRGSAKNSIDIPIPPQYKINTSSDFASNTLRMVQSIFFDYELHRNLQSTYKAEICTEKTRFQLEVRNIFFRYG